MGVCTNIHCAHPPTSTAVVILGASRSVLGYGPRCWITQSLLLFYEVSVIIREIPTHISNSFGNETRAYKTVSRHKLQDIQDIN